MNAGGESVYAVLVKGDHSQADLVTRAQDRFIAAWGQMGGAWGISRTMAEVFALLYITGQAMNTDDVMERLEISRGNASMSLRALQDWGIVARVHRRGDRKEYFEAERDVWTMFKTIALERKKRELDPVLASLYEVRDMTGIEKPGAEARRADHADPRLIQHNERMDSLLDFMSTMEKLANLLLSPEGAGVRKVIGMLAG